MKFPIGFHAEQENTPAKQPEEAPAVSTAPRKSVVQVHFPARNMSLAYYNDRFDLRPGDLVFVDGKLAGLRGRVTDVSYTFKIKLSDYQRVIAVADTNLSGEFFLAGSHFVTFDETALPFEKVLGWFRPPADPEEEYVSGYDGKSFPLAHPEKMGISPTVADRGADYYRENKVVYLSIDAEGRGRAIVEGRTAYTPEFGFRDGTVTDLTCSCFCGYPCKHGFAAMLQLRETLEFVLRHYAAQFEETGYLAAVSRDVFLRIAATRETGSFRI